MLNNFDIALAHTLRMEGGYVDDPDDPGGATNYGVTLRTLKEMDLIDEFDYDGDGVLTSKDIYNMTVTRAAVFYEEYFWNTMYDELPAELAVKLFDFGVNMGTKQAVTLLQRILQCKPFDGIYGPKTHRYALTYRGDATQELVQSAIKFYYNLADKKPALRKFLFGWLRRAYS